MKIETIHSKPVTETKYLSAENCGRYRPILRFFYLEHEKIRYWLYKEDIWQSLSNQPGFAGYTLEQCARDLEALTEWGNLEPAQDTSRSATIDEFKNKAFRYQLSEYSVEIERLMIRLENMRVERASLKPTRFEAIKDMLLHMPSRQQSGATVFTDWWDRLIDEFEGLNKEYQDYIRSFYSIKAEERMKSKEFIVYKDALIGYLREFIKGLQKHAPAISEILSGHEPGAVNGVLERVIAGKQAVPWPDLELTETEISEYIHGRWDSLLRWFSGIDGSVSEAARVLEITNEIIRKITRYAARIAEARHSAVNRREEYLHLCRLFMKAPDLDEAHKISSLVFGLESMRHVKGLNERVSESVSVGVLDEPATVFEVKPRVRAFKERQQKSAIKDKTRQKAEALERHLLELEQERRMIASFITDNRLDVEQLPEVPAAFRAALLKWIARAGAAADRQGRTEDGRHFTLIFPEDGRRAVLRCEDGVLEMPAFILEFEPEVVL